MSASTRDLIVCAIALVAALASARYYVLAVLDEGRLLSRATALAALVFGVPGAVFLLRLLI